MVSKQTTSRFTKEAFAKRLTETMALRNNGKANNSKLADAIQVQRQTIQKYRDPKSKNVPYAYTLADIADNLNVSADYLLCRTDIKSVDISVQQTAKTLKLTDECVTAILNMSDRTRRTLETILKDYNKNRAGNLIQMLTDYLAIPSDSMSLDIMLPTSLDDVLSKRDLNAVKDAIKAEGITPSTGRGANTNSTHLTFANESMRERLLEDYKNLVFQAIQRLYEEKEE